MRGSRIARRTVAALTLAAATLAGSPSPVASGPRPVLTGTASVADRWQPPAVQVDDRFATLPFHDAQGRAGTWVVADSRLPLKLVLEREVVDRFGEQALRDGLEVWNGVPGSRFGVEVVGVVVQHHTSKRRDGVSRVFVDRTDCDGDYLARAHLYPREVVERHGRLGVFIEEVDIGICERMGADRLAGVLRHELGHVAGLGHLCDPGEECHVPEMGHDNRCRVMFPAAYSCQEPTFGDEMGLMHLYPALPRLPSGNLGYATAAASFAIHASPRSVDRAVLVARTAAPRLQLEGALLAGLRGVPMLAVGGNCTTGATGEELNRVLQVHASVTLVGDVDEACVVELTHGWELETEYLSDEHAVVETILAEHPDPTHAVVVAEGDEALAETVLALPTAVRLRAPLLRADASGLTEHARQVLEATPSIRTVLIVGSAFRTSRQTESDLLDLGLSPRRIEATDRAATAVAVRRDHLERDPGADHVVLTTTDRDDLLAAGVLAARTGWPVLFTAPESLDARVSAALAGSAGGFVVGDGVSPEVQLRASRAAG